ncbi:ester cyclase, partial [Staphylococcus equorum]
MTENKDLKNENNYKNTKSSQNNVQSSLVFYADAKSVNMIDSMDDEGYLDLNPKDMKEQSMNGFGEYKNIVDYIVQITRKIWKEKD